MASLAKTEQSIHLVFAGDGPARAELEQLTNDLGLTPYVTFLGHLRDVRPLLKESGIVVIPSHTEGSPNIALEALAMQVPTVATNVGGVSDIIRHTKTGFLVPPKSPSAISNEVSNVIRDYDFAQEVARAGAVFVSANFEFTDRMHKVERIYDIVLPNSAKL